MKRKKKSGKRRPSALETFIVFGFIAKLTLTGLFLSFMNVPISFPLNAREAQAQEEKKEEKKDNGDKEDAAAKKEVQKKKPDLKQKQRALATQYKGMINALKAREDRLAKKEQQVKERENALNLLEKELKKRMDEIEAKRKTLDALVKRHEKLVEEQKILKNARIEHLVTAYKGMRPEKAGNLVNSLDDEVAVQLLAAMPGRNAGQILAFVEPEKAARLTKAISERKSPQNGALQDKKKQKKNP